MCRDCSSLRNPHEPRAVRIYPATRLHIRYVLIVAGASGAGKSTFMSQLKDGTLSPAIIAALPSGASGWPHTNGSKIRRTIGCKIGANGVSEIEGLVFHYDIMRVHETKIVSYDRDAALASLAKTETVIAVLIRAAPEQLARQLRRKLPGTTGVAGALRYVEARLRRLVKPNKLRIYGDATPAERHSNLNRLYAAPDFLEERYRKWERFLIGSMAGVRTLQIINVEPVEMADGEPSFRLV